MVNMVCTPNKTDSSARTVDKVAKMKEKYMTKNVKSLAINLKNMSLCKSFYYYFCLQSLF